MEIAAAIAGLTLLLAVASVTLNHLRLRRRIALETERALLVAEPAPWEREGGRDLTAPPPEAVALQSAPESIVASSDARYPPESVRPPEASAPGAGISAPASLHLPPGVSVRRPDPASGAPAVLRRDLTHALDSIPPLPPGTHEVLRDLAYPGVAARTLAAVVASEPFVRAAVLRGANAVLGDREETVSSGADGMHCLGIATTRALVLRLKVAAALRGGAAPATAAPAMSSPGAAAQPLWAHGLAVAAAADHLAARAGGVDAALAATIGLLHDVGKLALLRVWPAGLPPSSGAGPDRGAGEGALARERQALGGDHAAVGAYLAARWQLPLDVIEGIRRHHLVAHQAVRTLRTPLRRAILVVHVANQLAKYAHAYGADVEVDPVSAVMLAELGLPAVLERVMDDSLRATLDRAVAVAAATAPARAPRPARPVAPVAPVG